ncbi:receptor-like cytosolic serine/threonine-protein kinase RBK2 [Impatiens glandulifera]|uniref:receptor-like cytosolic serine/threonine-protein kinase RBK2 n=1 Tax=Impatiens glandulifera TaxID=253017 RepID=UPI001FB1418E|nr:receptor-like cytosolic serine/threonine-protein kinase RBK2 [Impatiens glandulifera]XP_047325932.1 receptor-like cytosolic serine/threonine-protein kinase RBK2 [Impatiens glandulifera]
MGEEKETVYSPVGVLEYYLRTAESETISSMASTSETDGLKSSKFGSKWRDLVQQFKSKSKKPIGNLHPLSVMKFSKRLSSSMREHIGFMINPFECRDSSSLKPRCRNFTIHELQNATNSFNRENLIGRGGYAEVFRGQLRDGQLVAIKRLIKGHSDERIADFLSELGVMAHVDHPNTAKLIGYGIEGGMHLVLELSPHGSLASLLHGAKEKLNWSVRYKIAVGTAEGLLYLHEGCPRRIIHRDIKASNILLSQDFEPRICDYGLSKWLPEKWTHHIVPKFEGTFGYLAPEYLMHGIVDEKTDVYAFGVLLLELVSGRRALDYSKETLVVWSKQLIKKNNIRELVDPSLEDDYKQVQLNLMVLTAFICIQQSSIRRPQMKQVVQLLKGNRESLEMVKKCYKTSFWKRYRLVDALNDNETRSSSREEDDLSHLLPSIQNLLSVGVLGGKELRQFFV